MVNWGKAFANAGYAAFTAIAGFTIAGATLDWLAILWTFVVAAGLAFFTEWKTQESGWAGTVVIAAAATLPFK
jgi:hypothetical protein